MTHPWQYFSLNISYENELGYWPFTNNWLTADLRARMSKELLQHKGNRRSILIHNKYHKFAYSLFATALSYDNRVEIHYWQKQISRHSKMIFNELLRILVYQKIYYCIMNMRFIKDLSVPILFYNLIHFLIVYMPDCVSNRNKCQKRYLDNETNQITCQSNL